jgi:hypothetical protein
MNKIDSTINQFTGLLGKAKSGFTYTAKTAIPDQKQLLLLLIKLYSNFFKNLETTPVLENYSGDLVDDEFFNSFITLNEVLNSNNTQIFSLKSEFLKQDSSRYYYKPLVSGNIEKFASNFTNGKLLAHIGSTYFKSHFFGSIFGITPVIEETLRVIFCPEITVTFTCENREITKTNSIILLKLLSEIINFDLISDIQKLLKTSS